MTHFYTPGPGGRKRLESSLPDEIKLLLIQRVFTERPDEPCEDCGGYHLRKPCLRVRRKVFHPNGNLVEVEYWENWDDSEVIYPEDVFDEETVNEGV